MINFITTNLDLLLTVYLIGIPVTLLMLNITVAIHKESHNPFALIASSTVWPLAVIYLVTGICSDLILRNYAKRLRNLK